MNSVELIKAFLRNKSCLILDNRISSRANLGGMLSHYDVPQNLLFLCTTYEEAEKILSEKVPQIIITEFEIQGRCTLDLMENLREFYHEPKESLFVVVTENTSQSAVAEAAEEDVDAYILKPYSFDFFRDTFVKTILAKQSPGTYYSKIEKGKNHLEKKDFKEAIKEFGSAMALHEKPSLACYYEGQTFNEIKKPNKAEGSFRKGLKYNHIHHKCSVALFEVLMEQNRYDEAYQLVKKNLQVFSL